MFGKGQLVVTFLKNRWRLQWKDLLDSSYTRSPSDQRLHHTVKHGLTTPQRLPQLGRFFYAVCSRHLLIKLHRPALRRLFCYWRSTIKSCSCFLKGFYINPSFKNVWLIFFDNRNSPLLKVAVRSFSFFIALSKIIILSKSNKRTPYTDFNLKKKHLQNVNPFFTYTVVKVRK